MLAKIPTQPYSHALLSPREQEIIRLVADGCPDKAIARTLGISPWTVNTHLRRIFTKLGVHSRAKMVAYVYQLGVLSS
jgi:DNA-binding CsgD family transcriptional regulator